jgi:hypothetical protein
MPQVAQIDLTPVTVTPVFKYLDLENVPQSEQKGHEVRRTIEVVEVHTAGSRNSTPVFPVDAMWRREGNTIITYAERWPEAYRAFKEGGPQNAVGTPLEMLRPLGITPEQISLCRAHKIYSIEALNGLGHDGVRALGVHSNKLRDAARVFASDRQSASEAQDEIAELRARLAALEAGAAPAAPVEPVVTAAQVEQEFGIPLFAIDQMSDEDIKAEIKRHTGSRPAGNPSRATLETALTELRQVAQQAG